MRDIVIVGYQSAGLTAAGAARLQDREAKVTVVERRTHATYHPCGLPFAVSGEIPDIRKLVEDAAKMPGVEVRLGVEAKSIDRVSKAIEVQDRRTLRTERISYDKLILATGSLAFRPLVPGANLGNVFTLRTLRDAEAIMAALPGLKRAVVVGAGGIGIEAAGALRQRGLEVTLVEMQPNVLPGVLDPDMAEFALDRLSRAGVVTKCGKPLKEVRGQGRVGSVVIEGEDIPADIAVLAMGVKPDIELAVKAGLKLGPTKAITVDDQLRTSDPDIFAIGDCAETRSFITKQPLRSQLGTTAIKMGKVAGANAAGGHETFDGVLNTVVSMVCGLEIATTGLTMAAAEAAGLGAVAARVKSLSKPHFFPGAEPIVVKIVAGRADGKVLGGQIVGDRAAERADMLALAIKCGGTVKDLARMDYCYAPPVNDCIEPIVVTADVLLRKLGH